MKTMRRKIPIFVVSLQDSLERRKDIESQLNGLNIDFQFFDAVHGASLPGEELSRLYDEGLAFKTCGRRLSPGEIGCSLSHLFLYKKMADEQIDQAIILEDDAILNGRFGEFYELLATRSALDLEDAILMLGGQEGLLDRDWWLTTSVFGVRNFSEKFKIKRGTRSIKYIARTCAYFIPLSVAKKIHQVAMPVHIPIDHWKYYYERGCFSAMWVVEPWVVQHPYVLNSQSLIEQERAQSVERHRKLTLKSNLKGLSPRAFNILKNLKHLARQVFRLLP